jgi:hypothetical protein
VIVYKQECQDQQTIKTLDAIENSTASRDDKQLMLLSVLEALPQEFFVKHLETIKTSELTIIVQLLCDKIQVFKVDRVIALGVVAAVLGGAAWSKMLAAYKRNSDKDFMKNVMLNLRAHYQKFLGKDIVQWIFGNWDDVGAWTLPIAKHLTKYPTPHAAVILCFAHSVDLNYDEIPAFVEVARVCSDIKLLVTLFELTLNMLPNQSKLSFISFKELINELMKD